MSACLSKRRACCEIHFSLKGLPCLCAQNKPHITRRFPPVSAQSSRAWFCIPIIWREAGKRRWWGLRGKDVNVTTHGHVWGWEWVETGQGRNWGSKNRKHWVKQRLRLPRGASCSLWLDCEIEQPVVSQGPGCSRGCGALCQCLGSALLLG